MTPPSPPTAAEALEKIREALEGAMQHMPRERAIQEGFFTRYEKHPARAALDQALALLPAVEAAVKDLDRLLGVEEVLLAYFNEYIKQSSAPETAKEGA